MKKILLVILSTLAITLFLFLVLSTLNTLFEKKIAKNKIQRLTGELPSNVKQASVTPRAFTLVNYFSPDCDHCQYLAEQITAHKDLFSDIQLYMITSASPSAAKQFASDYGLKDVPFVTIGTDSTNRFYEEFKPSIVPAFYLYDKNHTLITSVKGAVNIDSLVAIFHTGNP